MVNCTKESTWGQFGTPICSCEKCDESRRATTHRVFVRGIEYGPDLDWDYEKTGSIENTEWGQ